MILRRVLRHVLFATASLIAVTVTHAQSHVPATYDVSTIKPSTKVGDGFMLNWNHARLKADNVTVAWMLTAALDIRRKQLSGQPDWAKEQRFDWDMTHEAWDRGTNCRCGAMRRRLKGMDSRYGQITDMEEA